MINYIEFTTRRHAMTRYGDQPYEIHLTAVASILMSAGHDETMIAAAWLHDMIEDTGTTRGEIEEKFSAEVADLVWAVTGVGANRRARNESIYAKLALYPAAIPLKVADRIANVEAAAAEGKQGLAVMYLSEEVAFHNHVVVKLADQYLLKRLERAYEMLSETLA